MTESALSEPTPISWASPPMRDDVSPPSRGKMNDRQISRNRPSALGDLIWAQSRLAGHGARCP